MMASVSRDQRHLRNSPCEVCGGFDEMPRGQGKRCSGFTSADGLWCHCSRDELAGGIAPNDQGMFVHMMRGPCNCGTTHAERPSDIEAVYPYYDEAGELLFEVVRKAGKQFRQRKPDGAGAYVWKLGVTRRVLYRLPALMAADVDAPVYICEGEKDVATAERIGLVATCNPGGAGKWHMVADCARAVLRDRDVVIFRDADDVGRKHADQVATALEGVARSIAIVEAPVGKDLSDYVASGADLEAVQSLGDQRRARSSSPDEPARVAAPPLPSNVVPIGDTRSRAERQRDEDRARVVWGAELDTDPGPTPWSSYGLKIGPGRPTIICGEGGSRKSMFACYYSICVALGLKVLGRFDVEQGAGLYFDCEQGLALSKKRVRRFANGMGFCLADYNERIAYIEKPFNLDDEKVAPRLADLCRGFSVAIIDSVFRSASKLSQNDAEASIPMAIMARASSILGTTSFIGVDHASTKRDEKTQKRKAMQSGNHHKLDGSGTVYMLSAEKGKPTLVTCEREQTEGEYTEDFAFSVEDVPNPHVDEPPFGAGHETVESREHIAWRKWGLRIKEFGVEATEPVKKSRTDKPDVEPLRQIALRLLEAIKRQPGITSGELEDQAKPVQTKRFGDALKILIADKRIENRTGKHTRTEWVAK